MQAGTAALSQASSELLMQFFRPEKSLGADNDEEDFGNVRIDFTASKLRATRKEPNYFSFADQPLMAKTGRECDRGLSPIEKYRPAKSTDVDDGRVSCVGTFRFRRNCRRMSRPPGDEGPN